MCLLTRLRGSQVQILILNSFTKNVALHNKALRLTLLTRRGVAELGCLAA